MGMLTDFIQGAAKSASGIAENKLKEMSEENLLQKKAAIELEREKRVEEAQMRMHDRIRGEQVDDHAQSRTEKAADTTDQRTYDSQLYDKKLGDTRTDSETEFGRKKGMIADQRAYDEPVRNATLQNMSDTHESNQLSRQDAKNKLELQEQITDLNKEFINASPELQDELRPILNAMHGKYEKYAMVNQKIYDSVTGNVTGETSVPWNTATGNLKSEEDSNKASKDESKSSNLRKQITLDVIQQNESSNNPNAQNSKTSAGGLFQLIDSTALAYGAKQNADGTIPYEEKNRVAKLYYNDMFNRFDNDIPKVLAAGFGQNGVEEAVKKSVQADPQKGQSTNWEDYLSPTIKENLPEVVDRAKTVAFALTSKKQEVPSSLLRFIKRNDAKS